VADDGAWGQQEIHGVLCLECVVTVI
jgi:hypothetical protein